MHIHPCVAHMVVSDRAFFQENLNFEEAWGEEKNVLSGVSAHGVVVKCLKPGREPKHVLSGVSAHGVV